MPNAAAASTPVTNLPGASVSLTDIQDLMSDTVGRKIIPNYDSHDFRKYVKLTPPKDDTCAYHLIVDFTDVNFAVSASDAGTLDALLEAAKGFFDLAGVSNPKTIINSTQATLKGLKNAIKTEDADDEQKIMFHVYPCCHLGPQTFTITLNVTGTWLITDTNDRDEIVNLTGYLEASGVKSTLSLHADGTKAGAGTSQLFGKSARVSFETETPFLVVIYLHEDCHTDGCLTPPWKDAVSAIKITDIQVVIDTSSECARRDKITDGGKVPRGGEEVPRRPARRHK